jgi:hypothetical protein
VRRSHRATAGMKFDSWKGERILYEKVRETRIIQSLGVNSCMVLTVLFA